MFCVNEYAASQDELKQLLNIITPKYFIPYIENIVIRSNMPNWQRAWEIPRDRICVAENGNVIEISKKKIQVVSKI